MENSVNKRNGDKTSGDCYLDWKIKGLFETLYDIFNYCINIKKIIIAIICLICYVNCSDRNSNDEDVNKRWYKIEKLYNKIEELKLKFKLNKSIIKELRQKKSSLRKRIKQEKKAFFYLKKNNKLDLARTKYKTIDRLVAQAGTIESKLCKALIFSKKTALKLEALTRTKCTVITYYYMNGVLIEAKTRTIVVEFKELKKEMFVDIRAYDKGLRNPVVFRDNLCTII
ncbi:hypothetical protein NBO_7g0061 [Nosema bombycis CQ1]|uniref:Uncharacterized protein n=1 Tax=Nosema bombycis (strain CQ1 / CVCC 102059) TaxID=578461 RepID=R0MLW6_NOSB1|nr:hypothetical protein NBO_7g0061 [Nosema bombycis CQ1]|eukprot:EOB15240.1 hypothetical protein NBO_7g0061 [Nosema bombycis CQ1]